MMTIAQALQLENEIWNGDVRAYGIGEDDLARLSNLGWRWEAISKSLPDAKILNPHEIAFLRKIHKLATAEDTAESSV